MVGPAVGSTWAVTPYSVSSSSPPSYLHPRLPPHPNPTPYPGPSPPTALTLSVLVFLLPHFHGLLFIIHPFPPHRPPPFIMSSSTSSASP
eukprot:8490898-Pyramimonas_sp.AAC.1